MNHHHRQQQQQPTRTPSRYSTRKRPRSVEPVSVLSLYHRHERAQGGPTTTTNNNTTTAAAALLQHPQYKLLPGTLTEIAGPAGAGKTQMALTLCADSVVLNKKAVYVLLGGSSHAVGQLSRRLETMLLARTHLLESVMERRRRTNNKKNRRRTTSDSGDSAEATEPLDRKTTTNEVTLHHVHQWLQNIFLHWIRNSEDLMDFLKRSLPKLLASQPPKSIRLVVLDGIAHLFRHAEHTIVGMPGREHWQARSSTFFEISTLCKQLSEQHQVPFVILNQATTRIDTSTITDPTTSRKNKGTRTAGEEEKDDRLEPALGLSWKQCVNASFFIRGTDAMYQPSHSASVQQGPVRRRTLQCIKSPHVPANATLSFYIDHRGTVRICE